MSLFNFLQPKRLGLEDGASDWPTFAEKSKKLLIQDKVGTVFGCWTSASRKAVLPIFEKENGMLYYPTFYEGLEASRTLFTPAKKLPSKSSGVSTGPTTKRALALSTSSVLTTSGHVPR